MIAMEGYGRGEASNGDVSVFVEIRASGHRSKDIQIRVPQCYLSLERRLKQRLLDKVYRGKVDVFIKRTGLKGFQEVVLDAELAKACFEEMSALALDLNRPTEEIDINKIFEQPGVLNTQAKEPDARQEWIIVSTALDAAIIDLIQQRKVNGKELSMELAPELRGLQKHRGELSSQLDALNQALVDRLDKRLKKLLGQRMSSDKLHREAAILVDKSDITEELARVEEHCLRLGQLQAQKEKGLGRKMDIVVQDLQREMNTIGSKVIPAEASEHITQMKVHIENIRDIITQVE